MQLSNRETRKTISAAGIHGKGRDRLKQKHCSACVPEDSSIHIEFIEEMLRANVNVEPLLIFKSIWAKVVEVGFAAKAGKVQLEEGNTLYLDVRGARMRLWQNQDETERVKSLIAAAKERTALAKIPPKGSAA